MVFLPESNVVQIITTRKGSVLDSGYTVRNPDIGQARAVMESIRSYGDELAVLLKSDVNQFAVPLEGTFPDTGDSGRNRENG